ncbi:acetyl-hydrolase [Plenodomus tracheiphilus IPT5]|uniref:Acetyl-hydrolase n=1 Tax=Plenodomus tracheiphilus IPT5 TaxID=1408161 RepID=A0A6A7B9J1_9PLEO|nr:acetyl-hydrolase [Plenodomus tracheiphilus IPT5]
MESSPSALLKLLLPKTPFIFKTALWHTLSMSPTSSKWDLRTEVTINVLRDMIGPNSTPQPISKMQHLTCKDGGVKGKIWVSKVKLPVTPEDDVRQLLFKAIDDMSTGGEQWTKPENQPLEAEWNGYRAGVKDDELESVSLTEPEKYQAMMKETTSKVTVLYFHGGAMYLLDPATYRPTTSRIAKETGGRVFNVRYRLSPQHPFPAALLDAFTAYLSLLHPPPGSPHTAVPANEIVFGGDSAGGTCCTALLQLLLQVHRSHTPTPTNPHPTVLFHGQTVEIPLPAGLSLTSPWLDITRSLPSIESGTTYDYLPPPSHTSQKTFPKCDAWPASPPRAELYAESSALCHPLVSPLAARNWHNAPPVFISVGQEMLYDEIAVFAQRLAAQAVTVRWREFEAMPHCFAMLLEGLAGAAVHHDEFGRFCREVVVARSLERRAVDVRRGLTGIGDEEVEGYMRKGRERIEEVFRRGGDVSGEARPML